VDFVVGVPPLAFGFHRLAAFGFGHVTAHGLARHDVVRPIAAARFFKLALLAEGGEVGGNFLGVHGNLLGGLVQARQSAPPI
jgi:hypothetical protein